MLATPQGCHICFIIPNNTPPPPPSPPGTQNPCQDETYKTHLGSVISEQQVYHADHVVIYYMYLIFLPEQPTTSTGLRFYFFPWIETLAQVVPNNKIIPFCWGLEILSPRAGILKALLIRRMVTAVKEPIETQVANSSDTWLSSNGMRVFSREV